MSSKTPKQEPQTPGTEPIVNEQKQPTGGLLEPTVPHHLPDPFTDPGPLLQPAPVVDMTEEEKKEEKPSDGPGLVDPRSLQPGPVDK